MPSLFEVPINQLYGVGEKKANALKKLGVKSIGDLIRFYPRTYEDWSTPITISEVKFGNVLCCIKATVCSISPNTIVNGKNIFKIRISDGISYMNVIFFNNPYIKTLITLNYEYLFLGRISNNYDRTTMVSPQIMKVNNPNKFIPIYPQNNGISSKAIASLTKKSLSMLPSVIKDPIPKSIREKYNLCDLKFALDNIHFPKDKNALETAKKRLNFEELLLMQLGMGGLKSHRSYSSICIKKDYSEEFYSLLKFVPTNAQKRTVKECIFDLQNKNNVAMNRLIQGDVGSGKTAVASCVCYSTVKNGYQCAFMAPTEILAEQHYQSLTSVFCDRVRVALLTGNTKIKERRAILNDLANGNIDIVVGTHALISDNVEFSNLGLVVTDEQHRFGVAQRAKLLSKGENPHLLVMSATPIPRTLALVVLGDLDVSKIDEMPPGRMKIDTFLISSDIRTRALSFVTKEIDKGRQAYIVCPLVEQGESDLISAQKYANDLQKQLPKYTVSLINGKMNGKDKEQVMRDFSDGKINILVATTVIEVGVDVPNSTIMMIENAERFGLSQLHQLRGRVGRGKYKSYCILVSDIKNKDTKTRLQVMCQTNDGFEIAEQDLMLRGPGNFFGSEQHGLTDFKLHNFDISEYIEATQNVAKQILHIDNKLTMPEHKALRAEIKRLFGTVSSGWLN